MMTVRRTYECNFCGRGMAVEKAIGMYWVTSTKLEVRPASQCGAHLCLMCMQALQRVTLLSPSASDARTQCTDEECCEDTCDTEPESA
jgi:hypothetical protein